MKLKRPLIFLIISFVFFSALVLYNYFLSKDNTDSAESTYSVKISSVDGTSTSNPFLFAWQVDTNGSFTTDSTAIYWGPESSPSAFNNLVTPNQAGYPYHTSDYSSGTYHLPDLFEANIRFEKPGAIFYRAYAKINNRHYWSEEQRLEVKL